MIFRKIENDRDRCIFPYFFGYVDRSRCLMMDPYAGQSSEAVVRRPHSAMELFAASHGRQDVAGRAPCFSYAPGRLAGRVGSSQCSGHAMAMAQAIRNRYP
jgi:phage tail tape-measure protein